MRRRSKKRAKEEREYSKLRKKFLEDNPFCKVNDPDCCTGEATDVHHKRGRVGNLLNDVNHWLPICRSCHQLVELYPQWAKDQGFSESRLAKVE